MAEQGLINYYRSDFLCRAAWDVMTNFGFWNVDSSRDWHATRQNIPLYAADLASEHSLDLLFLIECKIPATTLMTAFTGAQNYFPIPSAERFKVLARFDPRFMARMQLPVSDDRFDIWHLKLPLQEELLVTLLHGPDKRNYDVPTLVLFLQKVVAGLLYCEGKVGHARSIVLGDFNASPFEFPVASHAGMNAVSSRRIAQGAPRRMLSKSFDYFYNPMWNLFGDARGNGVPATYYYRNSDLYWHMLDQVLIRPSLIDRFDFTALEIVTALKNAPLIAASGVPNRKTISDHLPVTFGLNLSKGDDGDKNVRQLMAGLRRVESTSIP